MRLLYLGDYPSFSLDQFAEDNIPEYAILSHTWGRDGDEVTYKDIVEGTGSDKIGYDKLHFCAIQAKSDGLLYCWIDTCCINKSDAAELTESINSMFRWYENAVKCYVYLTDVSTPISEDDQDFQLQNSRWFTRGWTLQELIAPRRVEIFSHEGERFGDRKLLETQIHHITGVSIDALRGKPPSHFTVKERLSWADNRTTKRPEDIVYSLLGIFDVHMETIYGEGEDHARERLMREIKRYYKRHHLSDTFLEQMKLSPSKRPDPTWIVPFERDTRFTGRESELNRLQGMLFNKHRTSKLAVTGLGGVGKTQLVVELLYRVTIEHKHCSILWIFAVNKESLHQSYMDVAQQLGIPGFEDEKADVKALVQTYLSKESAGEWLLVFDNADDIDMWLVKTGPESRTLIEYLPKSKHGAIIFTTRDRKTAVKLAQQNVVELQALENDTAAEMLGKCLIDPSLVDDQQNTVALLLQLTFLPLAIVQAAAYINENGISLAGYSSLLAEQEEEVIELLSEEFEDDGRYRNIKNPVATTWLISFDRIRQHNQLAADYLSFMACIEPNDIPRSLLPPGVSHIKESAAVGALKAYSFVRERRTDGSLDLHRLVHLATRNWLRKEKLLAQSAEGAILRLEEVFPNHEHQNRKVWRKYLAHASYALKDKVAGDNNDARTSLLWRLGMCLYQEGRWNEADKAFLQVMETRKRFLGPEHPDTLTTMANLASTYRNKGRWNEAEELDIQVMETRKKVLGPEHADTLHSIGNLASTWWAKGRWDEAEQLDVQVMETRKRVLGPEHRDTLTSMANLASTYWAKGRWEEAEKLDIQVMEGRKKVLRPEHPDMLTSMSNLASTYRNKGKWDEAEELELQVLETRKRVLGLENPDTLTSLTNLASTYWNKGRWDKAEELQGQAIEIATVVLGPKHPDTLTIMANLASTYREKRQWDKAEMLDIRVIRARRRVLGPEHADTLSSMGHLASIYREKGRLDEAEDLEEQVLETSKRVLGPEHPFTMTIMSRLSITWKAMGKRADAIKLMTECVQLRKRVLGVNHPHSVSADATLMEWQLEAED